MNYSDNNSGSPALPPDILALVRQVLAERFQLRRPEETLLQGSAALLLPPPPQSALDALLALLARLEELGRRSSVIESWPRFLAELALAVRRCQWQWQELSLQVQVLQQQLQDLAHELVPALYQHLPALQAEVAAVTAKLRPLSPSTPEAEPAGADLKLIR